MDLYAAARTSESHKTHDYPYCSTRCNLDHVKASVLKCIIFPIPLMIAKTKLVQREASGGQKSCHFNMFEGNMGHVAFFRSAHHRGKTGIHSEFIYLACIIKFSRDALVPYESKASLYAPHWHKHGEIKEEASLPDTVQVNRLKNVLN